MINIALTAALLVPAAVAVAGEKSPAWVKKLPANKWTQIDEKKSGNRAGAKVLWLEKEQKLYISGGLHRYSRRESRKPNSMLFDPATGAWTAYKGKPALPPAKPRLTLTDAKWKKWRVSVVLPEELKALVGKRTPASSPFGAVSSISRYTPISNPFVFLDPVNKEIHMIGGSSGGSESGDIGNWIYSIDKNQWRRSEAGSAKSRELRDGLKRVAKLQKDVVAAARNVYFANLPAKKESAAVKSRVAVAQAAALKSITEVVARVEKEGAAAGINAATLAVVVRMSKEGLTAAKIAGDGFSAGKVDAALIASADNAFWRLDEASFAATAEPTARRRASGHYDPVRKLYVLYGGDHGDYIHGDTWVYDCAKKSWRQAFPKISPPHRFGAQMFWLPGPKKIAMLGGSTYLSRMVYQRFSQPLAPEVWAFDLEANTWQLLVKPGKEIKKLSRDRRRVFEVRNTLVLVGGNVLLCPAVGGNTYQDYRISSTWMLKLDPEASDPALTAKHGVAGSRRLYRSQKVAAYNPQWYDAAPRGKSEVIEKLVAQMPTNQWVAMPLAPRPCPERSWGTSHYDTKRDQVYVWSGGHCADPSDIVHTFHPGINRWSLPYVAGGGIKGTQLTGRPDCNNHTYTTYAFDSVTKKLVALHIAGTHVYDPDKREWTGFTKAQPFRMNLYGVKSVGTPKGVVAWTGGCGDGGDPGRFFGVFDAEKLKWTKLPVKGGAIPANVHGDEGGMTWDSKRKALYIFAARAYQRPDGRVHRYDPAKGKLTVLDPRNRKAIGDKFHRYRETTYLPAADLVLFGMGFIAGRQIAYDPAGNRWVLTNISQTSRKASYNKSSGKWTFAPPKKDRKVGSITFAPVLDTRRNLLWAPSDYKGMYVMKLDPKTLKLSDASSERRDQKKK
jgi:hypothetical protein